jgi:hypothetical protein
MRWEDDMLGTMAMIFAWISGACLGFAYAHHMWRKRYEALQDEYATLIDRDPKTGRFIKSMRKLDRN